MSTDTTPWAESPTARGFAMVASAAPTPYWLDRPERPSARAPLTDAVRADLVVVGAGFSGLWTALQAAEENPSRTIVVLDAGRIGDGASGRNGGFCAASLTHGLGNGIDRYSAELPTLLRMGTDTLNAIEAAVERHSIEAHLERTGEIDFANFPYQADELRELARAAATFDQPMHYLDQDRVRARVQTPHALGGLFDPDVMMVDPAKLVWGLAAAVERLGVTVFENSRVTAIEEVRGSETVQVVTGDAVVTASRVVVATAAFEPPVRRLRHWLVPVWDHVIMTEPLTADQRAAIGWAGREGLADGGHRFHYFRLTHDDRILFGGWDAHYFYGNDRDPAHGQDAEAFALLGEHLLQYFPQLEGIRATHAWGGIIDTCSRFSAFWQPSHHGRVVSVLGFTGLGVGASHFAARTALDLVDGKNTERTRLNMVRSRPLPFPPEPVRYLGITLTRRAFARADRNQGRSGVWLRVMNAVGLGFDS